MARDFNGSSQYLSLNAGLATAVPFTFAAWIRPDSTADKYIFGLGLSTSNTEYSALLIKNADSKLRAAAVDTVVAACDSVGTVSTGAWSHVAGVWTGFNNTSVSDAVLCYLNGVVGARDGAGADGTPENAYNRTAIGALLRTTVAAHYDGIVAHAAFWNVGLTADEVASLAAGASPLLIRPASLVAYWPDGEQDIVGGNTLTNNGSTPASALEPGVVHRRRGPRLALTTGAGSGGSATVGSLSQSIGEITLAAAGAGPSASTGALSASIGNITLASTGVAGRQVSSDTSWTWFNDERIVYYNGKYYLGEVTAAGDIRIHQWDATGLLASFTLAAAFEDDDHDNPAIYIRSDGRIVAMYCGHNTTRVKMRISTNAEDISSWGSAVDVTSFNASYANIYKIGSRFYVFFRRASNFQWHYVTTTDWSTFSAATQLLNAPDNDDWPYPKFCQNGPNRIDLIYTDGHPNQVTNNSVYHVYLEEVAGTLHLYKTDGTDLGATLPIAPADGTIIYDAVAASSSAWTWQVAPDASGNPRVVFARFQSTTDHRAMFSRWTGTAWTTPVQIAAMGGLLYSTTPQTFYSGGVGFDGNNNHRVYVSAQNGSAWEILQYDSPDSGATWNQTRNLTPGTAVKNCRPFSPVGYDPLVASVFWWAGTYTDFTDYQLRAMAQASPWYGSLSASIGDIALTATGQGAGTAGTLSQSIGTITLAATGTVRIAGALSQSIGDVSIVATGVGQQVNAGALSASIGTITLAATGVLPIAGTLAQSIGEVTLIATGQGTQVGSGSLAAIIGTITLAATGTLRIVGALSASIGNVGLFAVGQSGILEMFVDERYRARPRRPNYTAAPKRPRYL